MKFGSGQAVTGRGEQVPACGRRRLASALAILCALLLGVSSLYAEKAEKWLEVRSPHFVLVTNGPEKKGRRVMLQFETIRAIWQTTFPKTRVDPSEPPIILAVKDEEDLKLLLPQYWEQKGRIHPAGIFLGGEEKHYVALRMDVAEADRFDESGINPYQVIYHEYIHLLTSLNYPWFPLWLNEGLAEFYGNTRVKDTGVDLGCPIATHIRQLKLQSLLPLSTLLTADHSSTYYNEANKATIFYAESWALTHYLILGDKMAHGAQFVNYVTMLRDGADPQEAARRTIGDPTQLESKLQAYLRGFSMSYAHLKSPVEAVESNFVVRELSPAESLAVRGDFEIYNRRPAEGRAMLAEALHLNPGYAPAYESMGFSYFREGKKEEAAKFLDQAVKLDSRNYRAHYFHAMLAVEQNREGEVPEGVVADLKRAIDLNPNFASAYLSLASVYGSRGRNLEEAHSLAAKGIDLEPRNLRGHLVMAQILLRQERPDEAMSLCRRVLAAAETPEERTASQSLMDEAQRFTEYQAEMKRRADQARTATEEEAQIAQRLERERAEVEKSGREVLGQSRSFTPPTEARTTPPGGMRAIVEGRISEVSCTAKGALKLTLARPAYNLELHAANYRGVKLTAAEGNLPDGFSPCRQLNGARARLTYKLGDAEAGEIVAIELQK